MLREPSLEGFKVWKKNVFSGSEVLLFKSYLGSQPITLPVH
jgi:hypothetical protein